MEGSSVVPIRANHDEQTDLHHYLWIAAYPAAEIARKAISLFFDPGSLCRAYIAL